jgi:TolA-binding protein
MPNLSPIAAKLAWLVSALALNALTVSGVSFWVSDYVTDKAMTGVVVSQSNLVQHMSDLQNSLDQTKALTDNQLAQSRGDLAREIASLSDTIRDLDGSLGKRLEENSNRLEGLNSTITGIDKRLSDTIARQEKVEGILLRQRVLFGAPPNSSVGVEMNLALWQAAGYDVTPLVKFDEVKAISDWGALSDILRPQ